MRICAPLLLLLSFAAVLPAADPPPLQLNNTPRSIALVDGKWIFTRVANITGEIVISDNPKEVNVYANRLSKIKTVSGKIVTVVEDVMVEVVEVQTDDPSRVFGLVDAPAGRYRIEILTNPGLQKRWEYLDVGEVDPPQPDPGPGPDPVTPEAGARFMVLLFESATQTPAEAKLQADLRRWDEGESKHRLVMLDKDVEAEWVQPYKESASYPWLVIQEDKDGGKILFAGKAPESKESFLEVLKKHGG